MALSKSYGLIGGINVNTTVDLAKIKKDAEAYYRNGEFFCSEAIVKTSTFAA